MTHEHFKIQPPHFGMLQVDQTCDPDPKPEDDGDMQRNEDDVLLNYIQRYRAKNNAR